MVAAALALAWRDLLDLPLTGEDFTLLAHVRDGGSAFPHLFRPLSSAAVSAAHALVGATAPALHAASLALHLANALLVYAAAAALLGRRPAALAGALAFAVGAGACDALAWFAAISRPLSAVGQLIALNGLVRWRARPRLGGALIALGLLWQGLANEEVYGTALLSAAWLGWCALAPRPERPGATPPAPVARRASLGLAALVIAWAALHFLVLQRVPGGAPTSIQAGLRGLPCFALMRSEDVMRGLGAPSAWLPVLLLVPAVLARRPQAALLVLWAWLASFVPFALEHPVEYRAYPTLAPVALCVAACVHGLAALAGERRRAPAERGLAAIAAAACLLGSAGPRAERLRVWRDATREVAEVDALLRKRTWIPPASVPALCNLDTTTAAAVAYRLDVGLDALRTVDFLDARDAFVPPADPPPAPWIGRRVDGSYGEIDPATYFARTALPELRLAGAARIARDLDDARRLLAEHGLDGGAAVVIEGDAAGLAGRSAAGTIEVLEPFTADPATITGRMRVRVRAEAPTILVIDLLETFSHAWRIAADQMLFSDVREARVLRVYALVEGEDVPRRARFADGLGFAVPLPAGEREVELAFRRATPEELR